jgi:DNA-binding SARP family transcriptional activator
MRALATAGRLLRAGTALVILAGFLGGVPWLLTVSAGWSLSWIGWPHLAQVPGLAEVTGAVTRPWSDQMILGLLASIGWVLWLIFVRHVIVEVIDAGVAAAATRHGRVRVPMAGHGPVRWVAAVLVGAIVGAVLFDAARAVTGTGGTTAAVAADAAARRPAVTVAALRTAAITLGQHTGPRPVITIDSTAATAGSAPASVHRRHEVPAWARDALGGVHHVVKGDNLWDIAEHKLGNPYRWREIYTLNRGHMQADGYALSDPDQIHTGWVLAMPAAHATPAHPHKSTPAPAGTPTSPHASGPQAEPGDAHPAPHASTPAPSPATTMPAPVATAPSTPPATADPSASTSPAVSAPTTSASAQPQVPAAGSVAPDSDHRAGGDHDRAGISLPSQGWVSLGLAALIAAVASLLRLQRRRHARLGWPIPTGIAAQPAPVPEHLAAIDAAGARPLAADDEQPPRPPSTAVAAPVGLDADGTEVSLFDLPGPGLALTGDGAEPAARALLAAVLATGATGPAVLRPVVVTTAETLARLLPDGATLAGLDPDGTGFDGERLIVLDDDAAAVTHAEEEMIVRRRLLDTFDLDAITALNERTDHAEMQPTYVLLIEAVPRHAARLHAVGAHRATLDLHPVILGPLDGIPTIQVTSDGTTAGEADAGLARMSTLAADDLAAVLALLTDAAARPEPGHDIDLDPTPAEVPAPPETTEPVPAQPSGLAAPVQLRVLGAVLVETASGPVATGMRSGSYLVLASLAVHPAGRALDQLSADLHPDTDPSTAGKRIRTDISTTRRVLRTASGLNEPMFVVYDAATGRYRLDAELITVDLWQMLTAIEAANTANDDTALAALREAARLYAGDFAEGHDQTWITDHATTYRHQILAVYARIAELLESDQPDQAVAALERALNFDPVNEELYQRIMRIHGRAGRPDQVRRTLRRLEERLADLGDAEPSEATRRVAERQLRPATASGARS